MYLYFLLSPSTFDESRYQYNSDKSQLTISGVARSDFGEYVCTATNKIGENNATFILDVSGEKPLGFMCDLHNFTLIYSANVFAILSW